MIDHLLLVLAASLACFLWAFAVCVPLCKAIGLWDAPDAPRKQQKQPVLLAGGVVLVAALGMALWAQPFVLQRVTLRPIEWAEAPNQTELEAGSVGLGTPFAESEELRAQGVWVPYADDELPVAYLAARDGLSWWAVPVDVGLWPDFIRAGPKLLALGLAFLVGLVDDRKRGGLSPVQKVSGQVLASLPLMFCGPFWIAFGFVLAAVAAMNILNTYDNADRTAGSLSALAFALWVPPLSLLLLMFLIFNKTPALSDASLDTSRGFGIRWPAMYLGDCGSHFLGMLFVLIPGAWLFLLVPALDLARVVRVRLVAGDSPFEGDRRHLAHLLIDRGLSARAMGFAMLAPSIPLAVGVWSLALGHGALWLGVGAAGSVVAFVALARWANPAHAVLKLR